MYRVPVDRLIFNRPPTHTLTGLQAGQLETALDYSPGALVCQYLAQEQLGSVVLGILK